MGADVGSHELMTNKVVCDRQLFHRPDSFGQFKETEAETRFTHMRDLDRLAPCSVQHRNKERGVCFKFYNYPHELTRATKLIGYTLFKNTEQRLPRTLGLSRDKEKSNQYKTTLNNRLQKPFMVVCWRHLYEC